MNFLLMFVILMNVTISKKVVSQYAILKRDVIHATLEIAATGQKNGATAKVCGKLKDTAKMNVEQQTANAQIVSKTLVILTQENGVKLIPGLMKITAIAAFAAAKTQLVTQQDALANQGYVTWHTKATAKKENGILCLTA